ncbi:DUF4235 domain-containing protein [Zhihengliuella halotolerans]|uniref:Uncharacterized protein DUF4235 n=1 Tax=Zhihengliuella halotolerans TaxID=370736 RepID=A0A4Q8ADW0_9MICC|nr:DUF4235 domain-containing protein [Zhihengliuella halotolerans]RZU62432.1 uncharacterized protein DUF4235 [Zhihengliuella halotolerans]
MNLILKLLGTAVSLGAGFAGSKIVDSVWLKATGQKPPKPGDKEAQAESSLRQALGFAVTSAIVAAVIQVLTERGTESAITYFKRTADEV